MRTAFIELLLVEDFVLTVFFAIIVSVLQNPTIEGLLSFSMFGLQFIALYLQVIFFGKKRLVHFFFFCWPS